jgi:putative membrane protein
LGAALYAAWLAAMTIYCLVRMGGRPDLVMPATAATVGLWLAAAIAAAFERHPSTHVACMLASGFGIALLFEHLGSAHGLIFGEYDYTELLGPRAFGVPVVIPAAWFMMLYPSWEVAGVLAPKRRLARVLLAAAAMTAWDLSLDPRMVADGAWIWPTGGVYFGIPLSNFAGWFVTAALIFTVWSWIDRSQPAPPRGMSLPVLIYVTNWLGEAGANALFWSGPQVAAIVFAAMGLFAVPAVHISLRGRSRWPRPVGADVANSLFDRIRPLARLRKLEPSQAVVDMAQHQVRTVPAPVVEGRSQMHSGDLA